jgi:sulfur-carrier protein adenylyltransferase/sulfurtransferase
MRLFSRKQDTGGVPTLTADELKRRLDAGANLVVVDVRQPTGYEVYPGTIPGALRIPPAELPERYQELPRDRTIVLFCT